MVPAGALSAYKRIEFDTQMGRLQFAQSFYVDYQGKFEL